MHDEGAALGVHTLSERGVGCAAADHIAPQKNGHMSPKKGNARAGCALRASALGGLVSLSTDLPVGPAVLQPAGALKDALAEEALLAVVAVDAEHTKDPTHAAWLRGKRRLSGAVFSWKYFSVGSLSQELKSLCRRLTSGIWTNPGACVRPSSHSPCSSDLAAGSKGVLLSGGRGSE